MNGPATEWTAGIRAVHEEAAGVLSVQIIRHADALDLMAAALLGDDDAAKSMTLLAQASKKVDTAKANRKPMLCASCPRQLLDHRFAFVIASSGDAAANHIVLAVCQKCARSTDEIRRKATGALRRIWPDLRPVQVHSQAGHA